MTDKHFYFDDNGNFRTQDRFFQRDVDGNEFVPLAQLSALTQAHQQAVTAHEQERDTWIAIHAQRDDMEARREKEYDQTATALIDARAHLQQAVEALAMLIRESSNVANDHHRPRYTRLDEALVSAEATLKFLATHVGSVYTVTPIEVTP